MELATKLLRKLICAHHAREAQYLDSYSQKVSTIAAYSFVFAVWGCDQTFLSMTQLYTVTVTLSGVHVPRVENGEVVNHA